MKLLRSFLLASALTMLSTVASAEVNPVYVVDVKGLDAPRVRAGVARELHGDAVAPDDPRARDAVGRVDIETKDGKATVTYRKVGAPVTRTVDLPDDATRAESTAILLTGNLARDEASELLDGLKRPAPPPPPAPKAAPAKAVDEPVDLEERDRAAIRAIFKVMDDDTSRAQKVLGWTALGAGVMLAAPGWYFFADGPPDSEARSVGRTLAGVGTGLAGGGLGILLFSPEASVGEQMDKKGLSVAETEALWKKEAESRRAARQSSGAVAIGLGLLSIGSGAVVLTAFGPHRDSYGPTGFLFGVGGAVTLLGVLDFLIETPVESSYRAWTMARTPPAPKPKPQVGFAALPGGAYGTVGFAF